MICFCVLPLYLYDEPLLRILGRDLVTGLLTFCLKKACVVIAIFQKLLHAFLLATTS